MATQSLNPPPGGGSRRGAAQRPGLRIPVGLLALTLLWWSAASGPAHAQPNRAGLRTWSDSTGKYRVEAEFVKVEAGKVYLRRKDGVLVSSPVERLSQADREYLQWRTAKPAPIDQYQDAAVVIQREVIFPDGGGPASPESPMGGSRVVQHPAALVWKDRHGGYVLGDLSLAQYRAEAGQPAEIRFSVLLRAGTEQEKEVDAEFVGTHPQYHLAVWRIAANGLPEPVPIDATPTMRESVSVTVLGCQIAWGRDHKGTIVRATRRGKLASVERDPSGRLARMTVRGEGINELPMGIVVDEKGQVLGVARWTPGYRTHPYRRDPVSTAPVIPVSYFASLRTPQLAKVELNSSKWDAAGIDFEATATYRDPFGRVDKAFLLLKRLDQGESPEQADPAEMASIPLEVRRPASLSATPQQPPRMVWRDAGSWDPDRPLKYVARLKTIDPDATEALSEPFAPQARYEVEGDPMLMSHVRLIAGTVQPHPDGGLQITRLPPAEDPSAAEPREQPAEKFPEPEQMDLPLAGPRHSAGKVQAVAVSDLEPDRQRTPRVLDVAWAADGKHAFFVLDNGVVRKIRVPEFREVQRLAIPVRRKPAQHRGRGGNFWLSAKMSPEGLVVVEPDPMAGRLENGLTRWWIVDTETLRVKRRITVPAGPMTTAPTSPLAFLFAAETSVIDLSLGRVVRGRLPRPGIPYLPYFSLSPIASPDGKYLFVMLDSRILRLRIEGADLVVEDFTSGILPRSALISADGKSLIVRSSPGNAVARPRASFTQGIYVYDLTNLQTPRLTVPIGSSGSGWFATRGLESGNLKAVDPASGNWYFLSHFTSGMTQKGQLHIVSSEGKPIEKVTLETEPKDIYPYPKGGAMLARLPDNSIVWLRLASEGDDAALMPTGAAPFDVGPPVSEEQTAALIEPMPDWVKNKAPQPTAGTGDFRGQVANVGGAEFVEMSLPGDYRQNVDWTRDGDALLGLSTSGSTAKVHRVSATDFRQYLELELPVVHKLGPRWEPIRSKEGVLLHVQWPYRSETGEEYPNLVLVDENTLHIKRAFRIDDKAKVCASPESTACILHGVSGDPTLVFDMATGKGLDCLTRQEWAERIGRIMPTRRDWADIIDLETLQFAANGRDLLCSGQGLSRLRLQEGRLMIHQSPTKIGTPDLEPFAVPAPVMCQDREHVAFLFRRRDRGTSATVHGENEIQYFVYRLDDLSHPVALIPATTHFSLAMDLPRKRIFTVRSGALRVYDYQGRKQAEYDVPYQDYRPRLDYEFGRMAIDPNKGRLLLTAYAGKTFLITLPDRQTASEQE